ncbi:MAG: DNA topoisomerase [Clostridia bacterium]|nr:DNA topoisomerase [Clostridia bacterium]
MSKILIIAEKPSLAKNIVAAITPKPSWVSYNAKTRSGYFESQSYIVSSAFGHLLELKDAEDYDPALKSWTTPVLPIIPESFEYKLQGDSGVRAQFRMLKELMARDDVASVVNAGDSDREGEIIIRNIITAAACKKPVFRLWMPDQTPKTIADELAAMKSDSDYDNLAEEGYARTFIDWLYGINLTRMATVKSGKLLRVGRVTSPIVTAICERERAIRDFVPEKYFVPMHDRDGVKLSSKKKFETPEECKALCDKYNSAETVVKEKKTERKNLPRPRLFALSDLQGEAGKAYKFQPKKVLDVLQKLYEAGYVSYPRTNSQYMAVAEKKKAKDIIDAIHRQYPSHFGNVAFRDSKNIFDDSKIESHSGLTPTYKIPDVNALPEDEKKLYSMVFKRFCSVFCSEEYTVDRTALVIDNGFESFTLTGDIVITRGYTVYEPPKKKSAELPPLEKGQKIVPCFMPGEKETEPPPHYTADSLNAYLKNPYSAGEKKELKDDEEAMDVISEVELGTEATRAGLIDAAIKSKYITLSKNRYGITPDGEFYVDSLASLGINMAKDRTLNLSKSLKQVYKGGKKTGDVVEEAIGDLKSICAGANQKPDAQRDFTPKTPRKKENVPEGETYPVLCKCGRCGGDILSGKRSWFCGNPDCPVALDRNERYFEKIGKPLNDELVKVFVSGSGIRFTDLVSARTGKKYTATVFVGFADGFPRFKMKFDER